MYNFVIWGVSIVGESLQDALDQYYELLEKK